MDVPTLLRRFDATLDWLAAVTIEDPDDESQSFYSSRRPIQFRSKRRLRRRFDNDSPKARILRKKIVKPMSEVTTGANVHNCLSDMTFIDEGHFDSEDDNSGGRYTTTNRDRQHPWTPDSSSTRSSSASLHNKYNSMKGRACTNQSCRESRWTGLKYRPGRLQRSASSALNKRKDDDELFIPEVFSMISSTHEDSRDLSSEIQTDNVIHVNRPVHFKKIRSIIEECENRQESLRQRRGKRLSVSIDLPFADPVYSRRSTPVETLQDKQNNAKQSSDRTRKFGESMDPNSDFGVFIYEEPTNSLCSASQEEFGEPDTACNTQERSEMQFDSVDSGGRDDTLLFNDEACTRLTGTLTSAVGEVNAYFHQYSVPDSRDASALDIMQETSGQKRWLMTRSQIEEIWGDEDSMIQSKTVVSSDDRREGKDTVVIASPKHQREQPPQTIFNQCNDAKIMQVPFVQGTDVTIAPTCYIATQISTPTRKVELKPKEQRFPHSSADTTHRTPCVQGTDVRINFPPQNETSPKIKKEARCTALSPDQANENTSPKWSVGSYLQHHAKMFLSRNVSENNPESKGEDTPKFSNRNNLPCEIKAKSSQDIRSYNKGNQQYAISSKSAQHCPESTKQQELPSSILSTAEDPGSSGDNTRCKIRIESTQYKPEFTDLQECSTANTESTQNKPELTGAQQCSTTNRSNGRSRPKSARDNLESIRCDAASIGCDCQEKELSFPVSLESYAVHADPQIVDSQANPSDFWDGEIEVFRHATDDSRRERKTSNKYDSKTLRELSQNSTRNERKPNDVTSGVMAHAGEHSDLMPVFSSSSGVERLRESIQPMRDSENLKDEARVSEDVIQLSDETSSTANHYLADYDIQELEHIEVVHVEESFDQGDFFQTGKTDGIIFAAFNAGYVDNPLNWWDQGGWRDDNTKTDDCKDSCSVRQAKYLKAGAETNLDDDSGSSVFVVDEYPATFLGVIPGKLSTPNRSEMGSVRDTRHTSPKTGSTFESPVEEPEIRAQGILADDAKHLTEKALLSRVQPDASASSVLFFKPTINVFGGESGAKDLAALTRAFNGVPEASSGKSCLKKAPTRPLFEVDLESHIQPKTQQSRLDPYSENDDDSLSRELARLATSERLLREELEMFQRKHSKASQAKNATTIIDLSLVDDSYAAATSTTAINYGWKPSAVTSESKSATQQSTRARYDSVRHRGYAAAASRFPARFNRRIRLGSPRYRFGAHYSKKLGSSTNSHCSQPLRNELQSTTVAAVANNYDSPEKQISQQLPRTGKSIDSSNRSDELNTPNNCCEKETAMSIEVNSRISLLRSRLDQKRSALRTAIDKQMIPTEIANSHEGQKKERSYTENIDSTNRLQNSMEQNKREAEEMHLEEINAFAETTQQGVGSPSSSISSKKSSVLISDSLTRLSERSSLLARLTNSSDSFSELDLASVNSSVSVDTAARTPNRGEDNSSYNSSECPQIEVTLSPRSLEFTTRTGSTIKGVELSSFNHYPSDSLPDVSIDCSEREKEVEVTLSPRRNEPESDTDGEKSICSGSASSSYISLSEDSSSLTMSGCDRSRESSQPAVPLPILISSTSTKTSPSFIEYRPSFEVCEGSSSSVTSRLSLPSVDSSIAEQILVSYRKSQQNSDGHTEKGCPAQPELSRNITSASRQRFVRFNLPLVSEPTVPGIQLNTDDRKACISRNHASVAPFVPTLLPQIRKSIPSGTRADPPGCFGENRSDHPLRGECRYGTNLDSKYSYLRSLYDSIASSTTDHGDKIKTRDCNEESALYTPSQSKSYLLPRVALPPKASRQIQISVPSKSTFLDKLKASKELRKSLLLGHRRKPPLEV